MHAVNQTYEIKLRNEGYTSISAADVAARSKEGVLEALRSIWGEHREDGWGEFENEEITRYICEKVALGEADFLSDRTRDSFRSLYRLIAERIRQHENIAARGAPERIGV
ncbi:MAG: hypothetical protein EB824_05020 [Thaumarchaeota archaeon S15]|nr:MAG: hypothetical protein EB824_05020 [Thaumarchaeota archaeon S15]